MINKELKSKCIYDCEYMLINNSIEDVIHVLEEQSDCYNIIRNDKYDNDITFKGLLESYFISVKQYYEKLLIKEGKADFVTFTINTSITERKYYLDVKKIMLNSLFGNGQFRIPKTKDTNSLKRGKSKILKIDFNNKKQY